MCPARSFPVAMSFNRHVCPFEWVSHIWYGPEYLGSKVDPRPSLISLSYNQTRSLGLRCKSLRRWLAFSRVLAAFRLRLRSYFSCNSSTFLLSACEYSSDLVSWGRSWQRISSPLWLTLPNNNFSGVRSVGDKNLVLSDAFTKWRRSLHDLPVCRI